MSRGRSGHLLATVLFTDIVDSSRLARELGDARWRVLLARHHVIVRKALKRHRGREIDNAGDGFFATFADQVDAIRCACEISDGVRELGIEIRAGCHVGQAEVLGRKVGGITVHAGARVMSEAAPSEVLVSSMIKDLVPASGFGFADRGIHQLKGIEGEWHLYAVSTVDVQPRPRPLDPGEAAHLRERIETPPLLARRWGRLGIAVFAIVLAAVAVVVLLSRGTTYLPGVNTVTRIDAGSNAFDQPVHVGDQPTGIAFVGGDMWVISLTDQTVTRINPSTGTELVTKSAQGSPTGIAGGPEGLFITTGFGATGGASQVMSVNLNTNQVQQLCEVPSGTQAITEGSGFVWVAVAERGEVWRLTPNQCDAKKISLGQKADPKVIASWEGSGSVWAGDGLATTAYKIDPGSLNVASYGTSGSPTGIAFGAGSVWITVGASDQVARLDPDSGQTQTTIDDALKSAGCNQPQGIAVAKDGVWVGCYGSGRLVRIDPATNQVVQTLVVDGAPDAVVADTTGDAWVTVHQP